MTQTAIASSVPSAPELQILLHTARRGNAARHGQEQAKRVASRVAGTAGAVAGVVWAFDLWLALGHSL